ncbi:MAG: hypothetical protein ACJ72G_14035 [Friedmanniella sp.]
MSSGSEPAGTVGPPEVDHPAIAAALTEVADLDDRPLAEHQARLSRVHEVLHDVLHPDPGPR